MKLISDMKKSLLSIMALASLGSLNAQVVVDTVTTGANYATNVWYSLANDNQATGTSTEWDLALAATSSQSSSLTSTILFNSKVGKVYAIPNSTPANSFDTLETVDFAALTALVNNDSSWTVGALNRTPQIGSYDYGWGSYDMNSHSILANRVFVVKYNDNSTKKFYINLVTLSGQYEIISADLQNGAVATTQTLVFAPYSSKNFVYYKINTNTVIDREPASANWDFTFLQYDASIAPNMQYMSFGILSNLGVEAVKVSGVANVENFEDYSSQTFSDYTNAIGYNWKNAQAQTVPNDVVYFVKDKAGDIWKLVFTKFTTGSTAVDPAANNINVFSKEKISSLSVQDKENTFFSIYPNPSSGITNIVVDAASVSDIKILDMNGKEVFSTQTATGLQVINVNTSTFNNGVYLVTLTSNGVTSQQRLVVQ